MALRNAFADLVTEPLALRLNQIGQVLAPLGLAIDKATSSIRVVITSGSTAVSSLPTLANVTTVATCSTVTSCTTLANQTNIGGFAATSIVADSMNTRWATCVRGRIT